MIIIVAALKGGVGKTTTSVYLSALAAARHPATLIDADPQASAADWLENAEDEFLERVTLLEAPTDRLLLKALDKIDPDDVAVVDTPPGNERLLAKAIERADIVVVPTARRRRRDGAGRGRTRPRSPKAASRSRDLVRPRLHAGLPRGRRRVDRGERRGLGEHSRTRCRSRPDPKARSRPTASTRIAACGDARCAPAREA